MGGTVGGEECGNREGCRKIVVDGVINYKRIFFSIATLESRRLLFKG